MLEIVRILMPVVLMVGWVVLAAALYQKSKQMRIGYPSCITCRHNLTGIIGTSEQCPECGCVIKDGQFRGADARTPMGCLFYAIGSLTLVGALFLVVGWFLIAIGVMIHAVATS